MKYIPPIVTEGGGGSGTDGLSAYQLAVQQQGFTGTIQEWLDSLIGGPGPSGPAGDKGDPGDASSSWFSYVSLWSTTPLQIGTTSEGDVFSYTYNSITRYRLVPSPYVPESDAFYANWDGATLSNLIVTRG